MASMIAPKHSNETTAIGPSADGVFLSQRKSSAHMLLKEAGYHPPEF
jgi:hypothetical protein